MVTNSVAVVTGGSGGIGLETAKLLAVDHHVVLSDTSSERLNRALDELDSLGVSAESIVTDVTDRRSVDVLMTAARSAGHVAAVVHAGGSTRPDASADSILRSRVLGTINVTAATLEVAGVGTTLVHANGHAPAANSPVALPRWLFRLVPDDPEGLVSTLLRLASLGPARLAPAAAHALSTNFLEWYVSRMTKAFDAGGARLWSLDPAVPAGHIDPRFVSVRPEAIVDLCHEESGSAFTAA